MTYGALYALLEICGVIIGIVIAVAALVGIGAAVVGGCNSPAAKHWEKPSAGLQAKRKEIIDGLVHDGGFLAYRTDRGYPEIFVHPSFNRQSLRNQLTFAAIVYAYYYEGPDTGGSLEWMKDQPSNRFLLIRDAAGKEIGAFGPMYPGYLHMKDE
jgi:hypothetical protein